MSSISSKSMSTPPAIPWQMWPSTTPSSIAGPWSTDESTT
jgi:hypothetical protein